MKVGEVWKVKEDCPHKNSWPEDKIKLINYLGEDLWEITVIDFCGIQWHDNEVISGQDLYRYFYKCEDQSWPEQDKEGSWCYDRRESNEK